METQDWLRAVVLSTITRDFPKRFWEDARTVTRQAYLDVFHQVALDPNVVDEQRLDKLYQDRHFLMENQLSRLAAQHGLACTSTLLHANNRCYVYVTKGAIGLTQAYVPTLGAMPKPARYRTQLAAMNGIARSPRLDFGDEPSEALLEKDFYGLLAHNPLGRRFTERDQRLGMLQFCVPVRDCSAWAVELTIEEIVSKYEIVAPTDKPDRSLPWKKSGKKKGDEA